MKGRDMIGIKKADIGILGGSGFYSFFKKAEEYKVDTPYGPPSDSITIGVIEGRRVAFMPRHGRNHAIPPHKINYLANIYAMKKLGVKRIFGPCASGSLQPNVKPGHLVVCDQFVDRTKGRIDTFYDGPKTIHMTMAEPYCPELRNIVIESAKELQIDCHPEGTVVVIQGPRFSTRAESRWFSDQGWEVINMTQYPEVSLARELEMCYVNISLITDYDAGLNGYPGIKPVTIKEVVRVFKENNEKVKELILKAISKIPEKRSCICSHALKGAAVN
jgi:5'-methylthioadenosine phosphorylase